MFHRPSLVLIISSTCGPLETARTTLPWGIVLIDTDQNHIRMMCEKIIGGHVVFGSIIGSDYY